MKRNLTKLALQAVFACLFAVGSIGAIVTGFDLPVGSMTGVFLWCAVFAVAFSLLFALPHGWKIVLGLGLAVLLFCWNSEMFMAQLQTLSYRISFHYYEICGWSIFGAPGADSVALPLLLWAAITAACVNRYYFFGEGLYAVLITAVLPLGLCMITLDTVPDAQYLFLLLFCFGITLTTDWTGRNQDPQRVRLSIYLGVPVALFAILLFALNPQDEYVNHAEDFRQKVESQIEQIEDQFDEIFHTTTSDAYTGQNLNLQNVGPKSNLSFEVMKVNGPTDGSLYLRGRDFDVYTGTQWMSSAGRKEVFSTGTVTQGKLTITTTKARDVMYLPYYSTKPFDLRDGASWNDDNILEYSYFVSATPSVRSDAPDDGYTNLPLETLGWAVPMVNEIVDRGASDEEKVRAIGNYVRSSAVYNRRTTRMDPAYDDFAQWFLEESDRGYCVHFATAATVLLRAAGIPARYVEGYLVSAVALKDVTVTNRDAHAWAEYYDFETGVWRVLEATPADSGTGGTETTEPATEPTETQPVSKPSETAPTITEPTETEPEVSTEAPTAPPPTEEPKEEPLDLQWMGTAIWVLLGLVSVPLQSDLRIRWKRKLWNRGQPNERAIYRWRQTQRLAKTLKVSFPEELDALAQKAKFSQHRMQSEELEAFEAFRRSLRETASRKPSYQRICYRLVLAIDI